MELGGGALRRGIVGKGAQQFVMTGAGLVRARKNNVDNAQLAFGSDSLCGNAVTRLDNTSPGGVLQRAHHCSADGDNASSVFTRAPDCGGSRFRDAIRLVEGQASVKGGSARRGDVRRMSNRPA